MTAELIILAACVGIASAGAGAILAIALAARRRGPLPPEDPER